MDNSSQKSSEESLGDGRFINKSYSNIINEVDREQGSSNREFLHVDPILRRPRSMSSLPSVNYVDYDYDSALSDSVDGTENAESSNHNLPPIPTSIAKERNYLSGRSGRNSLLGPKELERTLVNREVTIFVSTWNMNGEQPPHNMNDLLLPLEIENLPDIYAIGTQESYSDTNDWELRMQETIGPSHVLFHSESFGTLYLGIFVRRELIWYLSVAEDDSHSVRPGSAFKTKGALGICFYLFGSSFLFITSHLTAHDDKLKDRLNDVKRITKSLELPKELPIYKHRKKDITQNFDYVFWSGDLNFRVTQARETVIRWVERQTFPMEQPFKSPLYDQLIASMRRGLVFRGFEEGPITFPPTYKFDSGTHDYDTSSKQRIPSYTDRILFKYRKPYNTFSSHFGCGETRCIKYTSAPSFCSSDHKPVWGLYVCKIRPGIDSIPLAAGKFNRDVYLEGMKRRLKHHRKSSDSSSCIIQ